MNQLKTEVLVVGASTGGTAAAIQAARRGVQVVMTSETPWLGGMLTSAGVSAPDGNELASLQTGLWGAFLRELEQREPLGLHHSWVSFFSYNPAMGAAIFADWVAALPNLTWIHAGPPRACGRKGSDPRDPVAVVHFADYSIEAQIVIDGTELGDLLALADIPHRWGWEPQDLWQEPSAPDRQALGIDPFFRQYPVQVPTWVVMLRDFGPGHVAPEIPLPDADYDLSQFSGAWERYQEPGTQFLDYGRLPGGYLMINWPIRGNDYGVGCDRLIHTPHDRHQFHQEAQAHSQAFAHVIQRHWGRRYGLATDLFPKHPQDIGGGAFALHPYYRESRRLVGLTTVTESHILPQLGGWIAALPRDDRGWVTSIAIGNYANDHHYPEDPFKVAPKSRWWGGHYTGTPFSLPYGCLIPAEIDGLLVCDKTISVSHLANGATRLQPVALGLGQAAGMAAALCVEQGCQPRSLSVRSLQEALLTDPQAPAAVIPFWDLDPQDPQWGDRQRHILDHPEDYPRDGYAYPRFSTNSYPLPHPSSHGSIEITPDGNDFKNNSTGVKRSSHHRTLTGTLTRKPGPYGLDGWVYTLTHSPRADRPDSHLPDPLTVVTLRSPVHQQWETWGETLDHGLPVTIVGLWNPGGQWFQVDRCATPMEPNP